MPSVRASCCPLPLATPSGERVNHQSSVTLLCLNYKWGLFGIIKQICHASVGNMMECLPSGGWFSRGRSPRENHPPEGKHSIMLPPLAWHICIMLTLMLLVAIFTIQNDAKKVENDWNPGTGILIWEYSERAIQWIPTWQKMTETLTQGYSSESTQRELSNEYQHDRV